jgi:hypothetical protein
MSDKGKVFTAAKFSQQETATAWAEITVKDWLANIKKMKIGLTGDFERSFVSQVHTAANGDLSKISLAFMYYGTFVDMGVGRGTRLGDVQENKINRALTGRRGGNRRRPKKWNTLERHVWKLGRILEEKYQIAGFNAILDELPREAVRINL